MLSFNTYHRPKSIEEAFTLLSDHKRSQLLGGGAFLRMGQRKLTDVIDLSDLDLDYIKESVEAYTIGAMTNFHTLETSEVLSPKLSAYFKEALGQIVGIQLRSMVTLGGTVYSRYGFSDLNTALLALGGHVKLYKQGRVSMESFFSSDRPKRDVLTSIELPKVIEYGTFKSARLSTADYALLNMAVVRTNSAMENGSKWRISVGARPHGAILAHETMAFLNENDLNHANVSKASEILMSEINFGTNRLASSEYRRAVAGGLLKQTLLEVMSDEN